ncbi:TetR/AcrR family transcriptional regulator [Mesoterricola sediminis]|uniref:TetR family transcriptional regulator n=1 Tax=Mesoterricola sediminis TaxID=2927980 RepID=A0AA48H192_9BACT|nr:CerR family C-terminal domain-containing protein [Mesoterricola sediminis]BDU75631.1 TetR family transcriptional regulator [Mesoterricola sediminis]
MTPIDPESNTRLRLLEAAVFCFAEHGFDGTGIREIAQRAKANSALVQYHFGGKTGLYAAALTHIFTIRPLPFEVVPSSPDEPNARERAIHAFHQLVESLLREMLACGEGGDFDRAAHQLINRELQSPRPDMVELLRGHIQPLVDQITRCMRALRPDLDDEEAFLSVNSLFGQITHFHINLPMIRMMTGDPAWPRDVQALVRHIVQFSLRGLAVPEALPGARP